MTTSEVQAWLDRYIEAWQKNDPELVEALFTSDAVYRFRPYGGDGRVAEGIADIVSSWIDFDEDPASGRRRTSPMPSMAIAPLLSVPVGTSAPATMATRSITTVSCSGSSRAVAPSSPSTGCSSRVES